MRRSARYIWAGPWSLFGFLLSLLFRRRYVTRGVVLAEGAEWPRRLGWGYRAITFGHVVLSVDEIDDDTMQHEQLLVHTWSTFPGENRVQSAEQPLLTRSGAGPSV